MTDRSPFRHVPLEDLAGLVHRPTQDTDELRLAALRSLSDEELVAGGHVQEAVELLDRLNPNERKH